MVIRRQTWLLLLVLIGLAVFALVGGARRSPPPERSGELTYRQPTPFQAQAASAAVRIPAGFHRSHDCFLAEAQYCAARTPSIPPTPALLARWEREAGFSQVQPARYRKPVVCMDGHREGPTISLCFGVAMLDGQLFSLSANSAVIVRHGVAHGTAATVGRPRAAHAHLTGTVLNFTGYGFPDPEPHS